MENTLMCMGKHIWSVLIDLQSNIYREPEIWHELLPVLDKEIHRHDTPDFKYKARVWVVCPDQ